MRTSLPIHSPYHHHIVSVQGRFTGWFEGGLLLKSCVTAPLAFLSPELVQSCSLEGATFSGS